MLQGRGNWTGESGRINVYNYYWFVDRDKGTKRKNKKEDDMKETCAWRVDGVQWLMRKMFFNIFLKNDAIK